jgi:hypothetical protein
MHRAAGLPVKPVLLSFHATTLDQNNQNDDSQHGSNNLNNRDIVHHISSFFQQNAG